MSPDIFSSSIIFFSKHVFFYWFPMLTMDLLLKNISFCKCMFYSKRKKNIETKSHHPSNRNIIDAKMSVWDKQCYFTYLPMSLAFSLHKSQISKGTMTNPATGNNSQQMSHAQKHLITWQRSVMGYLLFIPTA